MEAHSLYPYAYILGELFLLLPVWLLIYLVRRDLRKGFLLVSFFSGLLGIFFEAVYTRDYWHPQTVLGLPVGIEDFCFGFFIGGIASGLYDTLFGKRFQTNRKVLLNWRLFVAPLFLLGVLINAVSILILNINSIYASSVAALSVAGAMIYFRRDLAEASMVSGLLLSGIAFVAYQLYLIVFPDIFVVWWKTANLCGVSFVKIPIEEIIWAFSWGTCGGILHKFFTGRVYV